MTKNPGKLIAVTGGGSGTGIAALIDGKCDITNASSLMKDFELSSEGQKIVADEGFFKIIDEYEKFNKNSVGM